MRPFAQLADLTVRGRRPVYMLEDGVAGGWWRQRQGATVQPAPCSF